MQPLRMLLLAVYGMEVVEAGGALALNAASGGTSRAHVLLTRPDARPQIQRAGAHLSAEVTFAELEHGAVAPDRFSKLALVRVLREVRPDVVVCQDPQHVEHDLDPDRRPAMTLLQESLALASRDWGRDELPGLEPLPIPTIYYMTPDRPNCLVDVGSVWQAKVAAMDELAFQHAFTARHYETKLPADQLEAIVPGYGALQDAAARGRALHRALDLATHLAHGAGGHAGVAFAEAYRREGPFELSALSR
jgi:N-acetylglucosamine malate deacetylase 1